MTPTLFDYPGMRAAADHAERECPGWQAQALAFLADFASTVTDFIGEDVVTSARGKLPDPPDARAWGSVFQTARRKGVIVKTGGFRLAPSSNYSAKPVWRRA